MADYRENAFPEDDATRGRFPMADGLLDYFPNALAAVAEVSKIGNDKHNPGQPMHHSRGKSMDHRNKIMRHLCDAGGKDAAGVRHSAYVAWRALALLQEELEREEGAPMARAAKPAEPAGPAAIEPQPGETWYTHSATGSGAHYLYRRPVEILAKTLNSFRVRFTDGGAGAEIERYFTREELRTSL